MPVAPAFAGAPTNGNTPPATPDQEQVEQQTEYNVLIQEYNLEKAKVLPAGVLPIVISSPEELKRLLESTRAHPQQSFPVGGESLSQSHANPAHWLRNGSVQIDGLYYGTVSRECHCTYCCGTTFHTWGHIRVGQYNSWRWIDSAWANAGLTGPTWGVSLTHEWTRVWYNPYHTRVNISGGGQMNVYILFRGYIWRRSWQTSCSFSYSVY